MSLTLNETVTGGEVPVYTIANGSLSGDAFSGFVPIQCSLVGTLDCGSHKLVGGTLDCVYCLGGSLDAGSCLAGQGHSKGIIDGDYDLTNSSFVNGTWSLSEEFADDGGPILGPGHYGGSGTWAGTSANGDP
jgi:hypothetical protein